MKLKRILLLLIVFLILSMCFVGRNSDPSTDFIAPNIENTAPVAGEKFTNPTAELTQIQPQMPSMLELEKQRYNNSMKINQRMRLDLRGRFDSNIGEPGWYVHSGGESEIQLSFPTEGPSDIGVSIYLFLDSQPQPYRTEIGEHQIMHIFYPPDEERITENIPLIPPTG